MLERATSLYSMAGIQCNEKTKQMFKMHVGTWYSFFLGCTCVFVCRRVVSQKKTETQRQYLFTEQTEVSGEGRTFYGGLMR